MLASIINGKEVAQKVRAELSEEVEKLKQENVVPGLAVILVGNDPASLSYIKGKQKASEETGIHFTLNHLSESATQQELLEKIDYYNEHESFHGILVQLPLPKHIEEKAVIERISPLKDVDGFHPLNTGKMLAGEDTYLSCTPAGIMKLLSSQGISPEGKHAVVVGRSNIVGKPVGQLLLDQHATVTYCHSRTKNLSEYTRQADILIAAAGKAHLIKGIDIKPGAVVIDVGVNRMDNGKLTGDVDFEEAKQVAGYITPVPGGVGPMTIAMLAYNTVKAAKQFLSEKTSR
ncbi:bifunctional methylenetetrahydrofolate dehydrogenase/methenyltetrahydrofolate cyclohydrolase FolD [Bacillus lacus]|uniref:Bifunctional protein FolD n=1 Tax=Metabacillus lacus TaxID=1983721 RepID=A0A7X2J0L8_9BACI|nr:bifunctional methylenetetrahydrofolate dehydrogenase/methenyltetrahydrofolate cyclohydrolase FolD [Metabacillus lacus]MRX73165.1 bifunctional methylenetetrahydrofolate dehydrogenase/methenyltetrahydrofolate cyclohydrolase FolD [Metabacillus lacus]